MNKTLSTSANPTFAMSVFLQWLLQLSSIVPKGGCSTPRNNPPSTPENIPSLHKVLHFPVCLEILVRYNTISSSLLPSYVRSHFHPDIKATIISKRR